MKGKFYVYILYRPWDGSPCYVGKGKGDRWLRHHMLGENHYNIRLARIFRKAFRLGLIVEKQKRYRNLIESEAFDIEKRLIKKYGKQLLTNCTDGGEGLSGHKHSVETKLKQSKAHIGRVFSEEHRARIGAASRGRYFSPEVRAKMGEIVRKRYLEHPEERKKTGAFRIGFRHSEEIKAKIAASHLGKKRAPFSEEWKRKIGLGNKGKFVSDETRKKMSKAQKGKIISEEAKLKMKKAAQRRAAEPGDSERRRIAKLKSLLRNPYDLVSRK